MLGEGPAELTLSNICGGAVEERFAREVHDLLDNIDDPNTTADQQRTITIEFKFKPFPDRKGATVMFTCKSKLAAGESVDGSVFFSKRAGQMRAYANDPRQEQLFRSEPPVTPNAQ